MIDVRRRPSSHEIGADEVPARARAEQDRPRRSAGPQAAREPLSRRGADLGGDGRGPRRAARHGSPSRFADRYEDVRLLAAVRGWREACRAVRARRADRRARRTLEHGVLMRARLPQREVRRFARYLVADAHAGSAHEGSAAERGDRSSGRAAARRRASFPSQAYDGRCGLDLAACERDRARARRARRSSGPASRSRSREGWAGLVLPRSGLAAGTESRVVNAPGLIDAGYRGEVKVIILNTDKRESLRRGAGNADRATRSRRGGRRAAGSNWMSSRSANAGGCRVGVPRDDRGGAEDPRLGAPALGRRHPALPSRQARARRLAAPGRRRPLRARR